ncbi:hypothetical protein MUK42_00929 [Musa troglodytarum]|uniref:F-box domain-containing protein n=1 Tax=Musa troglodytarum TaxID=320322 RepID=A0A9E7FAL1_9LILI|nr:hypothetical protein MUK42_00929 [Musa troglodytarum]
MADALENTCSVGLVGPKKLGRSSHPLPHDVLVEILSYLPSKTFIRLLSVCKTFHRLLSDSHFLLLQSCHNTAISGFLAQDAPKTDITHLGDDRYADVPRSSLEVLRKFHFSILGSFGGLLFVLHWDERSSHGTGGNIFVYNLNRRTRCRLPSPPGKLISWGGIAAIFVNDDDRVTKDYKLVYLSGNFSHQCRVYDSTARAWTNYEMLDFGQGNLDYEHPVVCGDTVFWVSGIDELTDPYIVAFDTRKESTQVIPLPEIVVLTASKWDTMGIGKWEGKLLSLIHYQTFSCAFTLWSLTKATEGAVGWVTAHEISLAQMGFTNMREYCIITGVMLSEVATTASLVFDISDKVYSYSIKEGKLRKLGSAGFNYFTLFPYVSSLRPCGDHEELLEAM